MIWTVVFYNTFFCEEYLGAFFSILVFNQIRMRSGFIEQSRTNWNFFILAEKDF